MLTWELNVCIHLLLENAQVESHFFSQCSGLKATFTWPKINLHEAYSVEATLELIFQIMSIFIS